MARTAAVSADDLRIKGQTGKRGLAVLLTMQALVVARGLSSYTEVKSNLGLTLSSYIVDKNCHSALSINLRPGASTDGHGGRSAARAFRQRIWLQSRHNKVGDSVEQVAPWTFRGLLPLF